MRRSLAGLLFGLASIVGSLAISGFWLEVTALSPEHTRGAAAAVLEDTAIKNELAEVIADATAAQLPEVPVVELRARIVAVADTEPGAALMADIIADSHARLIGERDEPVQITAEQLVQVVRDQRAGVVPTVTLPVPEVTALSIIRQTLTWLVPIAGGIAVLLIALGFAAHPEKGELFRSLAFLLFGMALLLVIIGYVVPAFIVPLFTDNLWVGALPRLARDSLPLLAGIVVLLCGAGVGCLAIAASSKRRDRWSQPIRRTSYREERRWN